MRATADSIELDQGDLCSIAAAGAAGVQLEHAIGSLDLPGLQDSARAALLTDPAVLRAYKVGENRWKADLERELTLRIHEPKRGSMASNALLMFTMRSRIGYKFAGQDDETRSSAPVILVSSNKLAKVQEAKAKAAAATQPSTGGPRVEVKVAEAGPVSAVQGEPVVEEPAGKARRRAAQRGGQYQEADQKEKEPWEIAS